MLGPLVLFVSTLMHPLEADPNDAVAAFTEYAADRLWVGTHLGQFLGVAIIVAALVMLSRSLGEGKTAAWLRIGLAGAIATLAATAVLQAVDGVALKFMVDRWVGAPPEQQLVLCSQSLFRFADLGDDGLCRGGPDKGCGVIVSAIDVVVDRLD